jgi:chitin synthase
MVIPVVYYIIIPVWFCKNFKEMCQFWAGLMIYIFFGPFCRIIVLCYSVKNIDSFGWGKTRQVIAEDNDDLGAKADKSQGPSTSELKKTPSEDLPERIDQGEEERKIGT